MPSPSGPRVFEKVLSPLNRLRVFLPAGPSQLSPRLTTRKGLPSGEKSRT